MLSLLPLLSLLLLPPLPLLLLPPLALAQSPEPPPLTWSMQAIACVPDESATPYRQVTDRLLTFRPGTFHAASRTDPLVVICPVTGAGTRYATTLLLHYQDPDGRGGQTRVQATVVRHAAEGRYGPGRSIERHFDSNLHGADVPDWQRPALVLANRRHSFDHATYTVQIALRRLSRFVRAPRVGEVRLNSLLPPELPEE